MDVEPEAPGQGGPITLSPEQFQELLRNLVQAATPALASATAALQNPVPVPVHTGGGSTRGIKLGQTPTFTGKPDETRTFVNAVKDYLTVNELMFRDDASKIIYMKSYMAGSARDWAQAKTDGYNDLQAWPTFETFLNDFEATYKPLNEVSKAALELDSIHQDNLKPKTVTNLVSRFRVLLAQAGMSERNDVYLPYFKKALNQKIFEEILLLPDHPTTLADWITKALKREYLHHEIEDTRRGIFTQHRGASDDGNNRMQIDAINIKCYNCQRIGHIGKDCPSPQRPRRNSKGRKPEGTGTTQKKTPITCFNCGKVGHRKSECQSPPKAQVRVAQTEEELDTEHDDHNNPPPAISEVINLMKLPDQSEISDLKLFVEKSFA